MRMRPLPCSSPLPHPPLPSALWGFPKPEPAELSLRSPGHGGQQAGPRLHTHTHTHSCETQASVSAPRSLSFFICKTGCSWTDPTALAAASLPTAVTAKEGPGLTAGPVGGGCRIPPASAHYFCYNTIGLFGYYKCNKSITDNL